MQDLTPEEIAELNALRKKYGGSAPTPTAVPTMSPQDNAELQALQLKLHGGPKPTDDEAMRYGMQYAEEGVPRENPTFADRLERTGQLFGEMTGVPGVGRLAGIGQPEGYKERPIVRDEQGRPEYASLLTPQQWDMLNTLLLGGGAAGAAILGRLTPFLKGLGLSAATGATAAGMTYPETTWLAEGIEDPTLKSAVQMGPGLAGSLLGPGVLASAGITAGSLMKGAGLPSAERLRAQFNPATEAAVMRGTQAGKYLDPRAAESVQALEAQGVPVSPAQAVAMSERVSGQRPSSSALADFERRTATTDPARRFQAEQGKGAKALVTREASRDTAKAAMSAEEAGANLIGGVERRIAGVGSALDDAEQALHSNKFMNAPDKGYAKGLGDAFANLMSDRKLFGKTAEGSAVTKKTLAKLNELYRDAKKVKTGSDAVRFTHRAVQELEEAFQGGGGLDAGAKGQLYGLLREATTKGIARNKSLKPLSQAWDKAMSDYALVVHEQGGKAAQQLAGVTPSGVRAGELPSRTSAGVSKAMGEGNNSAKVLASVKSGAMSREDAQAALMSGIRDGAVVDGVFRPDVFARGWSKLPSEAKALMSPKVRAAMDTIAERFAVLGDGVESRVMEKGYGAGSLARVGGGSLQAAGALASTASNAVRNFKPGYYGSGRKMYMPTTQPASIAKTAKVAIDTPMYGGQALANERTQDEKLEQARERAKRFMRGRK